MGSLNVTIQRLAGALAAALLLAAAGGARAQSSVTLTASPTAASLPDGQSVPMWGYFCGATANASCTAMNGSAQSATTWQPPLIRVPAGQALTITLQNQLSFAGYGAPTSLVIAGQLGGGLGTPTKVASPVHAPYGATWPGAPSGTDLSAGSVVIDNAGAGYDPANPPVIAVSGGGGSGAIVVPVISATGKLTAVNVTAGGSDYTAAPTLTVSAPPCTLNGSTCVQAQVHLPGGNLVAFLTGGTPTFTPPAQPARVQSFATEVAAGGSAALSWPKLDPGTYLIHSGTQPSIQHGMGLYAVLVVGEATANSAYGTPYDADVPLLFSEIDPDQNRAVNSAVNTTGFDPKATWAGPAACQGGAPACYPPAVNYTPLYYLINGSSFDRSNLAAATYNVPAAGPSRNVLLRLVNAGQRLHVPTVVGYPMTLLAEDGHAVRGGRKVQASLSLMAGKTFDVTISPRQTTAGTYDAATLPLFDRQLSLSTNNQRDGGMQAYLAVAGGAAAGVGTTTGTQVGLSGNLAPTFYCVAGTTLSVGSPAKGVLAGFVGASGVSAPTAYGGGVTAANLALNADGTFTYTQDAGAASCGGSFSYNVNGKVAATATIVECDAGQAGGSGCTLAAAPVASDVTFVSNVASRFVSPPPGVLGSNVSNPGGLALTAVGTGINADGSFSIDAGGAGVCPAAANAPAAAKCVTLAYQAKNAQGSLSNKANAYVAFMPASGLKVAVKDGPTGLPVSDYRWIIEEDRSFWVDPKCQVNTSGTRIDSQGRPCPPLPVESIGYNFHTASMPVVAQGCVGTVSCEAGQTLQGTAAVCDVGNGQCRTGASQKAQTLPGDVYLDPTKRYFISILPGDGINPTISGSGTPVQADPACDPSSQSCATRSFSIAQDCGAYTGPSGAWALYDPASGGSGLCGHTMGGAQIAPVPAGAADRSAQNVSVSLQQAPLPTAKIAVFVYEDDSPLNGENDAGGGVDVIAPNEPGLGGFNIELFDQAGGLGDNTGQITYDMFNQPVTNALAGQIDPITGLNACPITVRSDGKIGMIPTCPKYEGDGKTPSPLAGQVVVANLYPGLYEIQAYPAADRIARGEQWLQTNTLDGGKPHEAFIRPNEPGYFQEFGPGGFHVSIGFANPSIINARKDGYCRSTANQASATSPTLLPCNNTLTVEVSNNHMSRTPDQRTYDSESYDHYAFTQCYVSVGPADGDDFAIQPCAMQAGADNRMHAVATFTNMPPGTFKVSVFDQWNDIMLDGLVGTLTVNGGTATAGATTNIKFPVTQWRTNLYTRTFIDTNGSGVSSDDKPGLALVNTNIRYRDGSIGFFNNTDLNGYAAFNEVFPFMNWLVVETTQTRFKPTWSHTVYDAGGPVDCSDAATKAGLPCSTIAANLASTAVRVPLPADLRVPGAKYCDDADCATGFGGASTGTLFPGQGFFNNAVGWQGLLGQNTFVEFGVKPFKKATSSTPAENGGIFGQVIYASTRPYDDPSLKLQQQWEPGVPRVTINLYSRVVDAMGNEVLKRVDTTKSASFDDWAQGFRKAADGSTLLTAGTGAAAGNVPNMNCPGQDATSPFFATLKNSKQWLDAAKNPLAYNAQFKCYDGWSQLNQIQPAPYDGYYKFPSVTAIDPATGKPSATNCDKSVCIANPDDGTPMLPAGQYVVEIVMPPGYELLKEEDKNILMGDVYVAPVSQQFAGFGNVFILPDQAAVNAAYNAANPGALNTTTDLGSKTFPRHEGDTGSIESYWPCVGALRQVPDYNSLFPGAGQAAPFAGAMRNLCDRKLVTVEDESASLAKFFVFSSTHIAGHFTGTITNDFASEFDPFSPQFGEKFGPPNLPVGLRDFNGNEVLRVYSDQWGIYNGLYFSSWGVNPPNPTGYAPQMAIACMNDPGPLADGQVDPAYNPAYSNFCYEQPFMPGFTTYMDTPVIPTQSFADGYNLPDSEYPDGTPVVRTVVNASSSMPQGPWVRPATNAVAASASFTISGVNQCLTAGCANKSSITFPGGSATCTNGTTNTATAVACGSANANTRAANFGNFIRAHVATLVGAGYTAGGTGANVTITAPSAGASSNGASVVTADANITLSAALPLQLAGGTDAASGSLALTLTALGDKVVQNPNFSGPNATTAPYNQKTITRHYGFGSGGTAVLVAPDGVTTTGTGAVAPLVIGSWTDSTIGLTVPSLPAAFNCKVQQKNAPTAQCGQLVITRSDNGKRSIDAITVTVGGSEPWIVTPTGVTAPSGKSVKDYAKAFGRMNLSGAGAVASPIQVAIDSASPGDLILVQPGTYRENLIMWKPVRLQGVGATSVAINADAHPAGHMDQWRRQNNCVFGLDLNGVPNLNDAAFDPSGVYSCPAEMHQRVDRIPFEAIVGWDASGNGNLAQVLQEPTLMGAYEGAGITVLGRGVRAPACNDPTWGANCHDFWGQNATGGAGAFTDGSVYLTNGANANLYVNPNTGATIAGAAGTAVNGDDCVAHPDRKDGTDYGTSNFKCNPARVDGLSILNSSQGGGGMFIHSWAHNLEVANTRISSNHGTLAGAINLGNGETPDAFINDGTECGTQLTGANAVTPCPWIPNGTASNGAIPFQFNNNVRIHHNMLYNNASIGDALFSGTPAGGGAITVSAGADGYQIDHNWIGGNLSTGDGGGLQHLGLSFNGRISNNYVLFNQSTNPTLPTSGGGIVIEGANLDRQLNGNECGSTNDQDCPPGIGEGTGPGLVIDANLVYGNSAESGSGGGLRIQQVNGSADLVAFPLAPGQWFDVTVTNNVIANNVAGYDGGGVSLQDALKVAMVNNTIASNDTTASAGVLFKTLGAIMSNTPPPGCTPTTDPSLPQNPNCLGTSAPHGPQPSGLVTMAHTVNLQAQMPANVLCPAGYGYANGLLLINADCKTFSRPVVKNNLLWQNRTFQVQVVDSNGKIVGSGNGSTTPTGTGLLSQQNLVALFPGNTSTPLAPQAATGACPAGASYWDIGLRTDDINAGTLTAAANRLVVTNSLLTGTNDIASAQEIVASPTNQSGTANPLVAQVCNGARMPPEHCTDAGIDFNSPACRGFNSPPGASETTSTGQVFVFAGIQPTATVDEGHNWLNLTYGPLTLARPNANSTTNGEAMVAAASVGVQTGAYSLRAGSPAIAGGTTAGAPGTDFFGNTRTASNDIGAVQFQLGTTASINPLTLSFGTVYLGQSAQQTLTLTAGSTAVSNIAVAVTGAGMSRAGGTCGTTLPASSVALPQSCTIVVRFAPAAAGPVQGQVSVTSSVAVTGSPVSIAGNGAAADLTVSPATLSFAGYQGQTIAAQNVTLTNTNGAAQAVTGISVAVPAGFSRSGGSCPSTASFDLAPAASCTIGITASSAAAGSASGTLTASAGSFVVGGSTALGATIYGLPSLTPASLAFGRIPTGRTSAPKSVTLSNPAGAPTLTITSLGFGNTAFARSTTNAGTCGATLAAGASCTINVVYTAAATLGAATGTLTVNSSAPSVTGSPLALSGTSIALPALPALTVLDNFTRPNATTLGGNWYQPVIAGVAAIRVNGNAAQCSALSCTALTPGWAYWGGSAGGTAFGDGQAAAVVLTTTSDTPALLLKSSGTPAGSVYPSGVRVRYSGGAVIVETLAGGAATTAATLPGSGMAAGNTLTAQVDGNGNVYAWRTAGGTTTLLGAVPLGDTFGAGVTGAIGLYMSGTTASSLDNFAGGAVPSP